MNTQKLLKVGFGAAALATLLGAGSVLAQGGGPDSPLTAGVANVAHQVNPAAGDAWKAEQDAYLKSLATRLGISVDTLKQAMKDTSLEKLARMVTDGKLTQEQADRLKTEIESRDHFFFGGAIKGGGPGGHDRRGGPAMHAQAALATFLGIDEATLRTELQSGKSLATVATDHGKTRDQLQAFLLGEMTAELAQKVADGKVTQAEADEMKARMADGIDAMIDGTGRGPGGPGGHRGGHGGPGMRPGNPGSSTGSGQGS